MNHITRIMAVVLIGLFNVYLWGMENNLSSLQVRQDGSCFIEPKIIRGGLYHALTFNPSGDKIFRVRKSLMDNSSEITALNVENVVEDNFCINIEKKVNVLLFNPFEHTILAALGNMITLINVDTKECIKSFGKGYYQSGDFYDNGQRLATGTEGEVQLWDTVSSECIKKIVVRMDNSDWDPITFIKLSLDEKSLVISTDFLSVWDLEAGECSKVLSKKFSFDTAFHSDTHCLARGISCNKGKAGGIELWNMGNGELIKLFEEPCVVYKVSFNNTGTLLASALNHGTIRLLDIQTGKSLCTLEGRDEAFGFGFSPDGTRFIANYPSEGLYIWNLLALVKLVQLMSNK